LQPRDLAYPQDLETRQPKAAAVEASMLQEVSDAAIGMDETRSSAGNKYRNQ